MKGSPDRVDEGVCAAGVGFAGGGHQPGPASRAKSGRAAELGEQRQRRFLRNARSENAFQCGVDLGEQAADAVGQPGGLAGEVVVETDEDLQFGQRVLPDVDPAQGVRQGAGRVSDDERVAGVGLGGAGVQVRDAAHRQPRKVGHVDVHRTGHGDRQRTDRVRLVDHDQDRTMREQLREQRPQSGLVLGQFGVEHAVPGRVQRARVMGLFAHVQPGVSDGLCKGGGCRPEGV